MGAFVMCASRARGNLELAGPCATLSTTGRGPRRVFDAGAYHAVTVARLPRQRLKANSARKKMKPGTLTVGPVGQSSAVPVAASRARSSQDRGASIQPEIAAVS